MFIEHRIIFTISIDKEGSFQNHMDTRKLDPLLKMENTDVRIWKLILTPYLYIPPYEKFFIVYY